MTFRSEKQIVEKNVDNPASRPPPTLADIRRELIAIADGMQTTSTTLCDSFDELIRHTGELRVVIEDVTLKIASPPQVPPSPPRGSQTDPKPAGS
jgi:hypothetical protein